MCPLCKQVALDHDYLEKASLSSTAEFCVKRMLAHKVKEISEKENQKVSSQLLDRGMRRVLTEEAIYKAIDFSEGDSAPVDIYDRLVSVIDDIIKEEGLFRNLYKTDDKIIEKIEYLISFVKSLSRPFFTYRPTVATATVKLLKNLVESICATENENISLCFGEKSFEIKYDANGDQAQAGVVANLLLACVSGLANLNSTYLLDLTVTNGILKWFGNNKKYLFKKNQEGNIFTYFPDQTDSKSKSYNVDRSFADYLRMAIFRILRAEPYGKFRREKYDEALLEYLQNAKREKEQIEQIKEQIEQIKEQIEFYSLVYLENGPLDAKDQVDNGIDVLRDRMLWLKSDDNIKLYGIAGIIANSEPYVINEYDRLVPLTEKGYRDAFESGYEIKYNNHKKDYYPVVSAYDKEKMQLSGMLQLEKGAFRLLKKTGISISFSDEQKPKYVFVLLRYFIIDDEQDRDDKEKEDLKKENQENGEKKAKQGKEERQLRELVLRFNIDDLMNISGDKDNTSDAAITKQVDTTLLCGLRKIVILRREFIEKIGNLLNNDALRRLVSANEEKRALSLSKAAKHGNANREIWLSRKGHEENDAFITIQKLIANRILSAIYRIESGTYDDDCMLSNQGSASLINKFSSNATKKVCESEDRSIDTGVDDLVQGFYNGMHIEGEYKDNDNWNETTSELTIKANIDAWNLDDVNTVSGYSYEQDTREILSYMVLLFAYNALRHSKYYCKTEKTEKTFDILKEKNNNKIYLVCQSCNPKGSGDLEKAKKAVAIPPWIYKESEGGITLWSVGRYIKRCWDCYEKFKWKIEHTQEQAKHRIKQTKHYDELTDVFMIETKGNKNGEEFFKIKIRIK